MDMNDLSALMEKLANEDPCRHLKFEVVNRTSRLMGAPIKKFEFETQEEADARIADIEDWLQERIESAQDFGYCGHKPFDRRFNERILHEKYILGGHAHINDYWRTKHIRRLNHLRMMDEDATYTSLQRIERAELKFMADKLVMESKNPRDLSRRVKDFMHKVSLLTAYSDETPNRITYSAQMEIDDNGALQSKTR